MGAHEPQSFGLQALLTGHHAYVNSLALIPADGQNKEGEVLLDARTKGVDLLALGGNSSLILLHCLVTLSSEPTE